MFLSFLATLSLLINFSHGARLQQVELLNITTTESQIELKLHTPTAGKNSYFFVKLNRDDENLFNKITHVLNELIHEENHRLSLNIISFSPSPSGSSYNGDDVEFYGRFSRNPDSLKKIKVNFNKTSPKSNKKKRK